MASAVRRSCILRGQGQLRRVVTLSTAIRLGGVTLIGPARPTTVMKVTQNFDRDVTDEA